MCSTEADLTTGRRERIASLLGIALGVGLVVFLVLLPLHLVLKTLMPEPFGTYWKEMLLGLLVLVWLARCVLARRLLLTGSALDGAVVFYLALLVLRFILDWSGLVGAWGLYISVMYLPLFWLVPLALRRIPNGVLWLLTALVSVGTALALGGLVEFVLDRPLWPSDELRQLYGFADAFIYGTRVRRVYFTLDSPTALANAIALLLPLALSLFMVFRRKVARLAAGLGASLMGACLVVTFSRGIWVAAVVSLVAMALLMGVSRRKWRSMLVAGSVLAIIGLAWGLVTLLRPGETAPAYEGVVELSQAAYRDAAVTQVDRRLLASSPDYGRAYTQTWSLLDPISGQADERRVLYQHPAPNTRVEIIYIVDVPTEGALRFAIALSPETWSPQKGDGANFQLYVRDSSVSEDGQFVFIRYINPKDNPGDHRWRNFLVDLSPWAGKTVHLSLIIDAGPVGDWSFDWAGWADLEVVEVRPDYFASAQTRNAVLRHTWSIADWARDETNRDRLAAWSLGLKAWRAAPLWGQGLGTTGVAALRTQPNQGYVTESQILKALVELGPLGLLALAYLWFQAFRVGYRAYRSADDMNRRWLLLGIMTSLLIIFIEGLVYQNLEVKQVNAFFWTLLGALAFLAGTRMTPESLPSTQDAQLDP